MASFIFLLTCGNRCSVKTNAIQKQYVQVLNIAKHVPSHPRPTTCMCLTSGHLLPPPCRSFPFLPSGTGDSSACGCPRTAPPRPISGDSCPRFDGKTDGRGADRSTGVSSCSNMRYEPDDGAPSPPSPSPGSAPL